MLILPTLTPSWVQRVKCVGYELGLCLDPLVRVWERDVMTLYGLPFLYLTVVLCALCYGNALLPESGSPVFALSS